MKTKAPLLLLWLLFIAAPLYAGQTGDFSFITGLDGKTYTTASLKGTALVVNIGSHW